MIGHSLGSLILFDLLSGQKAENVETESKDESLNASGQDLQIPRWEKDLSIEDVFGKLEISEHLPVFTDQGIGLAELETCSEDDLKEAGLPLGPRKRLLSYLNGRGKRKSGFDEFQASSVAKKVSYNVSFIGNSFLINFDPLHLLVWTCWHWPTFCQISIIGYQTCWILCTWKPDW